MLWMLVTIILFSTVTFRVVGLQSAKNRTIVSIQLEALPNPLIVPWGNDKYYCVPSDPWTTPEWTPIDCGGAIQKFHDIEVTPKGGNVYEFIQAGAQQGHPNYYGQATPRQYTNGNCTMAIVNMNDTKLGTMVSGRLAIDDQYADEDFSSYTDIEAAVKQLYRICTVSYSAPGWLPIGDAHSTGIFLYATNSTIDKTLNGTEPDTSISDHLPEGWGYLGCNYDSADRALKSLSWSGEGLTVERCAAYCNGYSYFGVEFGQECYCGNAINTYVAIGGEAACDMPCNGDETEICGGTGAMSLYQCASNCTAA